MIISGFFFALTDISALFSHFWPCFPPNLFFFFFILYLFLVASLLHEGFLELW